MVSSPKIADNLYCGGNNPQELFQNWKKVVQALYKCNLRLSASKRIINPKSTTTLAWIWSSGTLTASSHCVNTLASCPEPDTVGCMWPFVGAYKVFSHVMPQCSASHVMPRCSAYLAPLEDATVGCQTQAIVWTDELWSSFQNAQCALSFSRTITLPRPDDQLWIVTDGTVREPGLGATL